MYEKIENRRGEDLGAFIVRVNAQLREELTKVGAELAEPSGVIGSTKWVEGFVSFSGMCFSRAENAWEAKVCPSTQPHLSTCLLQLVQQWEGDGFLVAFFKRNDGVKLMAVTMETEEKFARVVLLARAFTMQVSPI